MPALRDSTFFVGQAASVAVPMPDCQVGDRLFVFAFGGNRIWSFPGWTRLDDSWGQEAQGSLLTKLATQADVDATTYSLGFDGGNPNRVVTLAFMGEVGYELVDISRVGTAGVNLPERIGHSSVQGAAGNLICYFAGFRNGVSAPSHSLGALLYVHPEPHPAAFWTHVKPDDESTSAQLTLPASTGYYWTAVRFFDLAYGPWQQADLTPVIQASEIVQGGNRPSPGDSTYRRGMQGAATAELLPQAFSKVYGTPDYVGGPFDGFAYLKGNQFDGTAQADGQQTWLTLHRPDSVVVSDGDLPGPQDPLAIDVEWDEVEEPERLVLQVYIVRIDGSVPEYNPAIPPDLPMHVKCVTGLSDVYEPGYINDWSAYPDLTSFPAPSDFSGRAHRNPEQFDVEIDLPGVPRTGPTMLAVTLVDEFWQIESPPIGPDVDIRYPFQAMLVGYYRPRFRYVYEASDAPPPMQILGDQRGNRLRFYGRD